jgi:hypothetical protein
MVGHMGVYLPDLTAQRPTLQDMLSAQQRPLLMSHLQQEKQQLRICQLLHRRVCRVCRYRACHASLGTG